MFILGIEAFLAVARQQSFTKAAKSLNLAQSTVSKRILVLEQAFGTALIDRGKGNKKLELTRAGNAFIDLAVRWEALFGEMQFLQENGPSLPLAIGSLDSLNAFIFPDFYRMLDQQRPKLHLRIMTSHSQDLYEAVERRLVDAAFVMRELSYPNIRLQKCFSDPYVVLRLASAVQEGGPVHPRDLDPAKEVFVRWGPSYEIWHDYWWNRSHQRFTWVDNVQLILTMLYDPEQWVVLPQAVAKPIVARGGYSASPLLEPPPERVCYKITHKHPAESSNAALAVLDRCLAEFLGTEPSHGRARAKAPECRPE